MRGVQGSNREAAGARGCTRIKMKLVESPSVTAPWLPIGPRPAEMRRCLAVCERMLGPAKRGRGRQAHQREGQTKPALKLGRAGAATQLNANTGGRIRS